MRWLEMIKLRTTEQNLEKIVTEFIVPLRKNAGHSDLVAIQVYYHATIDTDLSIHIHWDTEQVPQQKTLLGSCLVNKLEDFGLIYHTLWVTGEKI